MNSRDRDIDITIAEDMLVSLMRNLFPGDGDEHGAVIAIGVSDEGHQLRLLAQRLFCARDGIDYVAGQRGYRMLKAEFTADCIDYCRERKLGYLAIHNHAGTNSVAFSPTDLRSHERGYPALLDLVPDSPIGALVFAENACAGDIWFPGGKRLPLRRMRVVGLHSRTLTDKPIDAAYEADERFNRQLLALGRIGQAELAAAKVAVIGLGGIGSMLVEGLARLGVGHLVLVDPDRIEPSNLSRVVGSTSWDARVPILRNWMPQDLQRWIRRYSTLKTDVATRVARIAQPGIRVTKYSGNFASDSIAMACRDCDFLFLAADSMQARLVFNAMVHQYLIPGIQMGTKVIIDKHKKRLASVYSVARWVLPGYGCLWCNGLISPHTLAMESKSERERFDQRYGTDVANPSVFAFNAMSAAQALNEFLTSQLGLFEAGVKPSWLRASHMDRQFIADVPRKDSACPECSVLGRLGIGDGRVLPTLRGTR